VSKQFTRVQATIPVPTEDPRSLHSTALATKELVETLAGQRGPREDHAVRWGETPRAQAPVVAGDIMWSPFPYLNGWADFAAPYSPCGFRKLSSGLVILRGLVTAPAAAAHITTLPPGYRPGIVMLYIAHHSTGFCRLDLAHTGELTHLGGTIGWISLNNVCFLAEN
jgi:hypothetical protein